MAGPNNINILISVQNKASTPIRQVKNDISNFRQELVRFNRNLFTASAVYASFAAGFRRSFDLIQVGAQFDFVREQFQRAFGSNYIKTLFQASRHTMDAMSAMRLAVQAHAKGMSKYETEKIFTLSVGAAKLMGTTTEEAAKKMLHAFATLNQGGLSAFLTTLKGNNQFKNMDLMIHKLTKGFNAAGMSANNFRKHAMNELSKFLLQFVDAGEDSVQAIMMMKAGFASVREVAGTFLSKAISPLIKWVSKLSFEVFGKLNDILNSTEQRIVNLRKGVLDFIQVGSSLVAVGAGLLGGFSLLAIASTTLGFEIKTVLGLLTLLAGVFKASMGSGKSWKEAIADIGSELKFYWQAVSSYKDGISTFTKDVTDRIKGMDKDTRNRIFMIAEAFILLRKTIEGAMEGAAATIRVFGKVFKSMHEFIFGGAGTKQFKSSTEDRFKGFGKILGVVGTLASAFIGAKALFGIFRGGFGRMGTRLNPMYVKMADGPGGLVGGMGGMVPILGKLGTGLTLLSTFLASYFGAKALLEKGGYTGEWGAKLYDITHGGGMSGGADAVNDIRGLLSGRVGRDNVTFGAGTEGLKEQLSSRMGAIQSAGGNTVDEGLIKSISADKTITAEEMVRLLGSIDKRLAKVNLVPDSGKPTNGPMNRW